MSKCIGKTVDFAAIFTGITKRGALPEEAFINTAKMTGIKKALKEIYKRWAICTDSKSSNKIITSY